MSNYTLKELKDRFSIAKEKTIKQEEDYQQLIYDLEKDIDVEVGLLKEEINSSQSNVFSEPHPNSLVLLEYEGLIDDINKLKSEYEFYDEQGELDSVFPDSNETDLESDSLFDDFSEDGLPLI